MCHCGVPGLAGSLLFFFLFQFSLRSGFLSFSSFFLFNRISLGCGSFFLLNMILLGRGGDLTNLNKNCIVA